MATATEVVRRDGRARVTALRFAPGGAWLAVGSADARLRSSTRRRGGSRWRGARGTRRRSRSSIGLTTATSSARTASATSCASGTSTPTSCGRRRRASRSRSLRRAATSAGRASASRSAGTARDIRLRRRRHRRPRRRPLGRRRAARHRRRVRPGQPPPLPVRRPPAARRPPNRRSFGAHASAALGCRWVGGGIQVVIGSSRSAGWTCVCCSGGGCPRWQFRLLSHVLLPALLHDSRTLLEAPSPNRRTRAVVRLPKRQRQQLRRSA